MSQLNAFPTLHMYSSQSSNSWCPVRHWNASTVNELALKSDIVSRLSTGDGYFLTVYHIHKINVQMHHVGNGVQCQEMSIHTARGIRKWIDEDFIFRLFLVTTDNIHFNYILQTSNKDSTLNKYSNVLAAINLETYMDSERAPIGGLVFWKKDNDTNTETYNAFVNNALPYRHKPLRQAIADLKHWNRQQVEKAYPSKRYVDETENLIAGGDGGWSFKLVDR